MGADDIAPAFALPAFGLAILPVVEAVGKKAHPIADGTGDNIIPIADRAADGVILVEFVFVKHCLFLHNLRCRVTRRVHWVIIRSLLGRWEMSQPTRRGVANMI
jgi:hypothetical protein